MMPKNNEFFDQVYQVVRLVPKGRVTTYGAIGKFLGSAKSARMVGLAMNNSHQQSPSVPAHRVVNRNGILTGKHHFSNKDEMAELLKEKASKSKKTKSLTSKITFGIRQKNWV
jgi:methylated-DNA-protein-cysteine methyltransferase related protein